MFCKKGVLKSFIKFTVKHLCQSLFIKPLAQVFSCVFCEISKNTSFYRAPPVVASELLSNCAVLANRSLALNVLVLSLDQYRRATSGGGLRCLFWKLKIGAIILGKNCSDCFHPRVTFLI